LHGSLGPARRRLLRAADLERRPAGHLVVAGVEPGGRGLHDAEAGLGAVLGDVLVFGKRWDVIEGDVAGQEGLTVGAYPLDLVHGAEQLGADDEGRARGEDGMLFGKKGEAMEEGVDEGGVQGRGGPALSQSCASPMRPSADLCSLRPWACCKRYRVPSAALPS
jgi:hypothetical protein